MQRKTRTRTLARTSAFLFATILVSSLASSFPPWFGRFASQYPLWLFFVRFVAPIGIICLFLYSAGILQAVGLLPGK